MNKKATVFEIYFVMAALATCTYALIAFAFISQDMNYSFGGNVVYQLENKVSDLNFYSQASAHLAIEKAVKDAGKSVSVESIKENFFKLMKDNEILKENNIKPEEFFEIRIEDRKVKFLSKEITISFADNDASFPIKASRAITVQFDLESFLNNKAIE